MAHNSNDRDTYEVQDSDTFIVEDPSSPNSNDDDSQDEQPKSKKGKYIMYGGIVALVGILGVTGMKMLGGSDTPPPAPKPAQIPVTQQEAPKPTVPETSVPTPVNVPVQNSSVPVQADNSQGIQMPPAQNQEQVLPDLNQKIDNGNPNEIKGVSPENQNSSSVAPDLNSASVSTSVPNSTVSEQPNLPVEDSAKQSTPDLNNGSSTDTDIAPIAPIGSGSTVPTTTSTPSLSAEDSENLNDSIKLLIKKMDGLSDSMNGLNETVKNTNTRIDNTDKKVDDLTKRVEKLESKLVDGATVKSDSAPVVKKSTVKRSPIVKHKRSSTSYNSVELSNGSHKRTVVRKTYTPKKVSEASSRLGGGYTLQSVVTDRAWIKRSDGTMATYGIGDRMPNGKVIGSIDPDNGVFDTTGKLIIK